MPEFKCPGSDGRDIKAVEVDCPSCGHKVELFSDEMRRKCPSCGARVERHAVPSCASWCASAALCLGADRYKALVEAGQLEVAADPEPASPDQS